jgi:hypothetical protein
MVFLREGTAAADEEDDGRCFAAMNSLTVAIALYLLAADLMGLDGGGGVVFVAVLLASPAAVPAILAWRSW